MGNCFKSENSDKESKIYYTVYQRGVKTIVPSLGPAVSNPLYKNRMELSKSISHDTSSISNTAVENSITLHIPKRQPESLTTDTYKKTISTQ